MVKSTTKFLATLLVFASATAVAEPSEIDWEELVPESERDRPPAYYDHSGGGLRNGLLLPEAQVSYGVVAELDGKEVKIPGFIVPLNAPEEGLQEALLVPYMGACIHMPPPPPNQIVYVKLEKAADIEDIWRPYWVIGRLSTNSFDAEIASAAYTLDADEIVEYEW